MKRIHFLRGALALPALLEIAVAVSESWENANPALMDEMHELRPFDMADIRVETFHTTREITNRDSGGWREFVEGIRSAKVYLKGEGVLTTKDFEDVASRDVIHIENLHGVTCDMYLEHLEVCQVGLGEPTWAATCVVTGALMVDKREYFAHVKERK